MPPLGRWQRFRLSRWFPLFWLVLFVVGIALLAGFYYHRTVLAPTVAKSPAPSASPSDLSGRSQLLRLSVSDNQIVAHEDFGAACILTVRLSAPNGADSPADAEVIVTLSSSSSSGKFESGSSVVIPKGSSSATTKYTNTKVGTDTITAFISEITPVTISLSVQPAAAAKLRPVQILGKPSAKVVPPLTDIIFSSTLTDIFDNPVPNGTVHWAQLGISNQRDVATDKSGVAYFVANFAATKQAYSAIIRASFGSSTQTIYLTVTP